MAHGVQCGVPTFDKRLSCRSANALYQLKYCQLVHKCTRKSHLKMVAIGECARRLLKVIAV